MTGVRTKSANAAGDAVPFLIITGIWLVVAVVLYGLFLVAKPDIQYPAWAHAFVFAPSLIGYLGHVLRQAFSVMAE